MICLGIESTAHTFGVGIMNDKKKVLSNARKLFTTESGGINPIKAKEHHLEHKEKVISEALEKASLTFEDIDLISFSQAPGMSPSLLVGMKAAKEIAEKYDLPLVGVNHCIAHLEIGRALTSAKDPVLLYASGANTQIIAYDGGKYRIFGETLDNGVGNFIDGFARYLGFGFPGGPKVEELAKSAKSYVPLPYVVKGMDVSFSGIQTNLKQKWDSKKYTKEDLCHSLQETVFAMLVEVSERALAHCGKNELVIGGGVGCNARLAQMCTIMCEERGATFHSPERQFLVDNGAMIAWQGILQKKHSTKKYDTIDILPYQRTDEVEVDWR